MDFTEADWSTQQSQGKPFAKFTVNVNKQWLLDVCQIESILTSTIINFML